MKIKARSAHDVAEMQVTPGARLLDYLRSAGVYINASCGGKGTCHKCRIQVQTGFLGASAADRRAFRDVELSKGWRLSCQAIPRAHLEILVPEVENFKSKPRLVNGTAQFEDSSLICDLGSTGVVVGLINEKGDIICEAHLLNMQVKYGADVMTRLQHAQESGLEELQVALLNTIKKCLVALKGEYPEAYEQARQKPLLCSGNSAMVSFLHQWNIDSLATSPFQPEKTESALLGWEIHIRTLPLLSGFVGADTFAGIFYLESIQAPKPWMMVDIGTNTEIVIAKESGEFWFSSAPAGPAFEGGNITKGMRAEPGAIAHATCASGKWQIETIGNDKALGICGSGLIDILAEGVLHGLITQDGYIPTPIEVSDGIGLYPDDIREFQLAKSATRTACDILIDRAAVTPQSIYLAGTFAQHLRAESVEKVGLLPSNVGFSRIGNASFMGTIAYALATEAERTDFENRITLNKRQVELALQDDFQDAFVRNLNFL